MDSVWQRSINRWQKVLRMNRVWWNCCIEMDEAAKQFDPFDKRAFPKDAIEVKVKETS